MGFHLDFGGPSLFLFEKSVCSDSVCDAGRHCTSQSFLSDLDKMEEKGSQVSFLAQSDFARSPSSFFGKQCHLANPSAGPLYDD